MLHKQDKFSNNLNQHSPGQGITPRSNHEKESQFRVSLRILEGVIAVIRQILDIRKKNDRIDDGMLHDACAGKLMPELWRHSFFFGGGWSASMHALMSRRASSISGHCSVSEVPGHWCACLLE